MSKIIDKFKRKKNESTENEDLIKEMYTLEIKLKKYEYEFNMIDDNDLIEALIYERKALQARFSFLTKLAKEKEIELNFFDRG